MKRNPGNEVTALFFHGFGGENDCPDYSVQNDGHTEDVKCSWKNNCYIIFGQKDDLQRKYSVHEKIIVLKESKKNTLQYRYFECKQDIKTDICNYFFWYFVFYYDFIKLQNRLKICSSRSWKNDCSKVREKNTLQYRNFECKKGIKTHICNLFFIFCL